MGPRDDLTILLLTLKVAIASTALILPGGLAAAWLLARYRGRGASALDTALSLPLVLPPTVIGLGLLSWLGRGTVLGGLSEAAGVQILFTWKGAVLASAVMSFPLLVRSARTAFEEVDPRLLGIARTLGRGPWAVFFRVALPLSWRGVLAGVVLALCRALGEFGATILVAGNIPGRTQTLALAIFHRTETGHDGDATRLAVITIVVAFAGLWLTQILSRRGWVQDPTR